MTQDPRSVSGRPSTPGGTDRHSVTSSVLKQWYDHADTQALHEGITVPSSRDPYFTPWMDRADLLRWAPGMIATAAGSCHWHRFSEPQKSRMSERAGQGGLDPRTEGIGPHQAASVDDRIGLFQDPQRIFEAPELKLLTAGGRLFEADDRGAVGCRTKCFARDLSMNVCDPNWRCAGPEMIPRMCPTRPRPAGRMSSRGAGRTARSCPLRGPRRHHHDRAGFPAGVLVAERPH